MSESFYGSAILKAGAQVTWLIASLFEKEMAGCAMLLVVRVEPTGISVGGRHIRMDELEVASRDEGKAGEVARVLVDLLRRASEEGLTRGPLEGERVS